MNLRRTSTPIAALAIALAVVATGCGASGPPAAAPKATAGSAPAATADDHRSLVLRPEAAIEVHETAEASSPSRTIEPTTAFGTPTTLLVTGRSADWLEVLVPGRPTGATGWVQATAGLHAQPITTEIRVDLQARTLTVLDGGKQVLTTPVAVGAPATPTPTGRFSVTDKLDTQDPGGAYGRFALGLSGRSEVLTEFAGGDGQIGIHGTDDPSSIGNPVSHGCIRVPNEVMDQLNAILPLGTPVVVS